MSKFKVSEMEYCSDEKDECGGDPFLSVDRVESPENYNLVRAIVWKCDGLAIGDFKSEYYVKLVGFVYPGGDAVRLCVQKFNDDEDLVLRQQCWIIGAGIHDMDEIAKAIETGPVIEGSRKEGRMK